MAQHFMQDVKNGYRSGEGRGIRILFHETVTHIGAKVIEMLLVIRRLKDQRLHAIHKPCHVGVGKMLILKIMEAACKRVE